MVAHLLNLGLTDYQDACRLQIQVHQARVADRIGDVLLLTEHFPVYTHGRTTREAHLGNREQGPDNGHGNENGGAIAGIPLHVADRGGSVTYHGPGQIVGYPILKLREHCAGPKAYVARLEETIILALAWLGLSSGRRRGMPGVWMADRKIAAVGVRIARSVTRHGFALNVANDLRPFSAIIPCGLAGFGVTSVLQEQGEDGDGAGMEQAKIEAVSALCRAFQEVFEVTLTDALVTDIVGPL